MARATEKEPKARIKKLTTEKLQQFRDEILKGNGQQADLTSRGIESIVSLDGLQNATKLDLSHNKLTKLSQLKAVSRVTMLKLTDNKLSGAAQRAHAQGAGAQQQLHLGTGLDAQAAGELGRTCRCLWVAGGLTNWCGGGAGAELAYREPQPHHADPAACAGRTPEPEEDFDCLFCCAENLKVLELSHNEIDDWSGLEALSSLENLRQLNLIGNPIVGKKLEVAATPASDSESSDSEDEEKDSDSDDDKKEKKKSKSKKKADISEEVKQQIKEAKKLDAKHKQYNFKMKRLFPNLVVRDAVRVLDKRVHGYVAPPKEEKNQKNKKLDPSDKKNAKVTGKRKREDSKKPKAEKESVAADNSDDADKVTKKEKKALKKHKGDKPAAIEQAEPEKKSKHRKKQDQTSEPTPMEVEKPAPVSKSASKDAAKTEKQVDKEKKRKEKQQEKKKKEQRQPKEIASGVVAVKQFKKSMKAKSTEAKPVDLAQLNFTPDVGFGGSSAWD
ncbi:unnamed protein product [Phytophthora fragariaefolia]|uniref:Unnamed protein product n=1 Tax=Phytophthora fragariaefolia TaxID=1490495 RepID=A0A9W6TUN9_9STRA|nr:unnamed protein product [Phytophthora fragariaefolia]